MSGRFSRLSQPQIQAIIVSAGLWLSLAITAWLNREVSQIGSRVLSGVILGTTATIIAYYVINLPHTPKTPGVRNMLGTLYPAYALFVYCLYFLLTQGTLLIGSSLTFGQNLLSLAIASFLLGMYMNIGVLLDQYMVNKHQYIWLGLLASIAIYAWIAGILVRALSQDIWFLASLPTARLASSLVFGRTLANKPAKGTFLALGIRFAIVNLLVLPVTILLSR